MTLLVGQIWKDNYRYAIGTWERYVRVLAIDGGAVTIKTCSKGGVDCGHRKTTTKATRFNGKTGGFSLVEAAIDPHDAKWWEDSPDDDETLAEHLGAHSWFHFGDQNPTAELMRQAATRIRKLSKK